MTEMKCYANPAADIVMVIKAVCLLRGVKESWNDGQKLMANVNEFLNALKNYPKDTIKEKLLKSLKKYTKDPAFEPKSIAKKSKAATSLCLWVRAIDNYAEAQA